MSGFEAVGIILPLLLTAFEHWDACTRPFTRYKKFEREARDYVDRIEIERTIFREECRYLLGNVVGQETISSMLGSLAHSNWQDERINGDLANHLGDSLGGCLSIVKSISQQLQEVGKDNRELGEALQQEHKSTPKSLRDKAWRRKVVEKLKFSFSEKRLDRATSELQNLNNRFIMLSKQTRRRITATIRSSPKPSQTTCAEVHKYQAVGKASRKVYEALCRACNKHTEHLAHFRVEVEKCVCKDDYLIEVKFDMAFTHQNPSNVTLRSKPIWFLVDTTLDERVKFTQSSTETEVKGECYTLKRQACKSTAIFGNEVKKRVRFKALDHEDNQQLAPEIPLDTDLCVDQRKRDFCDHLRRRFRPPLETDACVVLERTQQCKHLVLPSAFTVCSESREAVSLGQLIKTQAPTGPMPGLISGIPLHERVRLAKMLAITVLQLHNTPWIGQDWSCNDILFFDVPKKYSLTTLPDLSAPHLNAKISERCLLKSAPTPTIARNPLLFSLCAVLLELAFASSLEHLQQPCDLESGESHGYFFTARRLAKEISSPMGARYNGVVEQLLIDCISSNVEDLCDSRVQKKLYEDVVCPLEELERGLRNLYIGKRIE